MAAERAERRAARATPAIATYATAGEIARPRQLAIPAFVARLVHDVVAATGLMALWQGAIWLFAVLVAYAGRPGTAPGSATELFIRILLKGEGLRHLSIARGGYDASTAGHPPFFAMLTRLLATFGVPWNWAGALIGHVALVGALVYLIALARLDLDEGDARRALGAALLWPAAPLLGMVGPNSLLLLTVTAALYHGRRRQWGWAGVWAAHASLTGGVGVLILIPLFIEWLDSRPWRLRPGEAAGGLAAVLAAPVAFVAFLGLLRFHIGTPWAYFWAQAEAVPGALLEPLGLQTLLDWRAIAANEAPLVRGYPIEQVPFPTALIPAMIDSGIIAFAALCGIWLVRDGQRAYGYFVLAGVVATLLIGGLPGSATNLLPFVPIYLVCARWLARPVVGYLALILAIDLIALYLYLAVNGYWPI